VRGEEELSTLGATAFAGGLADALLAVHYLGILLVEVRHLSPAFQVRIQITKRVMWMGRIVQLNNNGIAVSVLDLSIAFPGWH